MEAVAKLKNCGMSARKMRLVADLVRGKGIDDALDILRFTKKEAAYHIEKTLLSAISNWEQKNDMMENAEDYDLIISRIQVDDAPQLKRIRPAPHGRAHRIRKRYCHLTLVLENKIPLPSETEQEEEYEEEYEEEVTENLE
ncbi:MAG: 50S ribosomal protein L22 [Saprospirales bacterium]|nr:MAG: 50S ribosomal protein L22 [Saprospirales bacterium]